MRKGRAPRRDIRPDPVFQSLLVSKAINIIMLDGKKYMAQQIFYEALELAANQVKKPGLEVFEHAIKNASPSVVLKSRRMGGSNYQVPAEASETRKETLALRWIITFSRKRTEYSIVNKLACEIVDAYNNTGLAIKRKNELIRMAESNKAFSYFRF